MKTRNFGCYFFKCKNIHSVVNIKATINISSYKNHQHAYLAWYKLLYGIMYTPVDSGRKPSHNPIPLNNSEDKILPYLSPLIKPNQTNAGLYSVLQISVPSDFRYSHLFL